jgi:hypothetical protein
MVSGICINSNIKEDQAIVLTFKYTLRSNELQSPSLNIDNLCTVRHFLLWSLMAVYPISITTRLAGIPVNIYLHFPPHVYCEAFSAMEPNGCVSNFNYNQIGRNSCKYLPSLLYQKCVEDFVSFWKNTVGL